MLYLSSIISYRQMNTMRHSSDIFTVIFDNNQYSSITISLWVAIIVQGELGIILQVRF